MLFPEIKLINIDSDDINDVLIDLEKSFDIKFANTAFQEAETFGDLCDVVIGHVMYRHEDTCTSQQAFYKLRKALSVTLGVSVQSIHPDSSLEKLFPRRKRRKKLKELQHELNVKFDILRNKEWLTWTLLSVFCASFVALLIDWRIGGLGLCLFGIMATALSAIANELAITTVRDLTLRLSTDHYMAFRRRSGTINKNELLTVIEQKFGADLMLDKQLLTRDAQLP